LLTQRHVRFEDLARYPLAGSHLPEPVEQAVLGETGREMLSIQCDNFLLLMKMTEQSDAICLAPRDVVQEALDEGRLIKLDPLSDRLSHHSAYGLVNRRGHQLSPAGDALRAEILRGW
jgi:DNA-binding transcriptional LysR family regulator